MLLEKSCALWKRRMQARLFDILNMQALLDARRMDALEDMMGFRGQLPEHRRFQMDKLQKLGLKRTSSVLEIGCGPLTAGIPVIRFLNPDRYVGIDVRSEVLDLSWQEIGLAHLSGKNPRLIRSDAFGAIELGTSKFDFVWAFSVLYHLSDRILDELFANIAIRLMPKGRFVANVQTDVADSTWLEFPFLKRSAEAYESLGKKHGLQMSNLGTIEEHGFGLSGAERNNRLLQFTLE